MNENENQKDSKNEENGNRSDNINNKDKINNSDKNIEDSEPKENSANPENKQGIINNNENDKLTEQNMEQKILDYEAKLKEIQGINISLNNKMPCLSLQFILSLFLQSRQIRSRVLCIYVTVYP